MKMPAFEWVHVQLHQQKGMISLSPPTICNSAFQTISKRSEIHDIPALRGHLRTMTMPQYEKFQQFMLNLIK
ncbi:hypothetical protein AbaHEU2_17885 [Acinetobacter baumannii]|nr:hypothetical protein AbaHEU2_17885 [Acinetobacter baumannii]